LTRLTGLTRLASLTRLAGLTRLARLTCCLGTHRVLEHIRLEVGHVNRQTSYREHRNSDEQRLLIACH
jgi:hypothetical protein